MNLQDTCAAPGCSQPPAAVLDVRLLCREHFFQDCYTQMDTIMRCLRDPAFQETGEEPVRQFLTECTRQAADLAGSTSPLDNLERARVLDILLRASEIGGRLRRSARRHARFSIHLLSERPGHSWKETTETIMVSQHGAAVRCGNAVQTGAVLRLVCAGTGREAPVRVVWQQSRTDGAREIGIEFLRDVNFWGMDWGPPDAETDSGPALTTRAN